MFKIQHQPTGALDANTYICFDDITHECFIVDPAEWLSILNILDENKLNCTHILLTHGHFDHISGVAKLKEKTGAKVYIHTNDAKALHDNKVNLSVFCGSSLNDFCEADILLEDGDVINAAGKEIRVLHTPGHSRGSVCYIIEDERTIFSGDTLFRLSVGRADFYGSNPKKLEESIKKLTSLQGNYTVLPGHNRFTELDFERKNNSFISQ